MNLTFAVIRSILPCILFVALGFTSSAQDQKITADNVSDLEFGYALPGACWRFSPNDQYIATSFNGVYDVVTGVKLFSNSDYGRFSADSSMFVDGKSGDVIDIATTDIILETNGTRPYFAQNDQLLVADEDGVYEVSSGNKLYAISGPTWISPQENYIFVYGTGVVDLKSGQVVIESSASIWDITFSPDDDYIVIEWDVFDISSNTVLFKIKDTLYTPQVRFSPSSEYLAVQQVGVYTVPDDELILESDGWAVDFSSTGNLLGITGDGIYRVDTWQKLLSIEGGLYTPIFSTDDTVAILYENGIYDITTGTFLQIPYGWPQLSPDNTLIVNAGDGIYDPKIMKKIYDLEPITYSGQSYYSNNSQTLAMFSYFNRDYNEYTGDSCMIYGIKGTVWSYRSGIVQAQGSITAYSSPDGGEVTQLANELIVFSQTPDHEWYRVSLGESYRPVPELWVRASDVISISLPDGIPVEQH